jgi:hypothetical protein
VAGTNPVIGPKDVIQDEVLTIKAIIGTQVTVDRPLAFDHVLPNGVSMPVAYLDRSVVLTSESTLPDRRGHVMLMSGGDHHVHLPDDTGPTVVAYAMLEGLGRTRADMLVTDPELDEHGALLPPRDAFGKVLPMYANQPGVRNDRGRYSLHFHQNGTSSNPSAVKGISVVDGLKWGVVNHESNVVVEDSVTFQVDGAGFATESGIEKGSFHGNLSIRSMGGRGQRPGGQSGVDIRQAGQFGNLTLIGGDDLGWQGYGFWLQGPLLQVQDNIAIGHLKEGFAYFSRGLQPDDMIPVADLPEGAEALATDVRYNSPVDSVRVDWVPFEFAGNTAIGSRIGLGVYNHFNHPTSREYDLYSRIEDSDFVNVHTGFIAYYGHHMVLSDVRMVNNASLLPLGLPNNAGSEFYGSSGDITWDDVSIENFRRGIVLPNSGDLLVRGGYFKNAVNIYADNYGAGTVTLEVGPSNFETPSAQVMNKLGAAAGTAPWNVYLATMISPDSPDISEAFRPTQRTFRLYVDGQPENLFFRESDRNYRFDTANDPQSMRLASKLPDSILAMTAGELWDTYGLGVNGVIAPEGARTLPGLHGVVSPNAAPPSAPFLRLESGRYTNQVQGHTVSVRDLAGKSFNLATTDLVPNQWNFVTGSYNGQKVTELIYAKTDPAGFVHTDSNYRPLTAPPTTISMDQLAKGFTVYGRLLHVIGKTTIWSPFSKTFKPGEMIVDADGKVRLQVTYADFLGNQATMELVLTVV